MDAFKDGVHYSCWPADAKPGYMWVPFILDCIYPNSHQVSTQPTADFKI